MIYQHQSHLPITYLQLHYSHVQVKPLGVHPNQKQSERANDTSVYSPLPPALRVLTQRQALRGTKRASREHFINEVESLGTELILTHRRYAHSLGAVVLTRTLPQVVSLLYEVITEPRLDPDELEQSKRAYIAELDARYDDDHAMAWLCLARRLHVDHPLWSDYTVDQSQVEAISIEDVRNAWPKVFHPDALLPCITSNLSQSDILDALRSLYKPTQEMSSLVKPVPTISPLLTSTLTLVHKPDKRQASIFIAHPTLTPDHPQSLALKVALCALGGTFSSPLMQEVRVKRGLSYGAYAGLKGEANARFVCLNATPDAKDAAETLEVMLAVFKRGAEGDLSDETLLFAKDYLINAHPFSIETPAMRAGLTVHAVLMGVDPDRSLDTPKYLYGLTVEEIRQAARDHLSLDHLEILIYGDQEGELKEIEQRVCEYFSINRVIRISASATAHEIR